MKKCAVILNGDDVVKVTNFPRKYNKLTSNPRVKILEECEPNEIENRFIYWKESYIPEEKPKEIDPFTYNTLEFCSAILYNKDGSFRTILECGTYNSLSKIMTDYGYNSPSTDWMKENNDWVYIKTQHAEIFTGFQTAWKEVKKRKEFFGTVPNKTSANYKC